jgi:hypothetical protein
MEIGKMSSICSMKQIFEPSNNNEIEEMKNSLYRMSKLKTDVCCIVQNRSFTLQFMDHYESQNLLHSSKLPRK